MSSIALVVIVFVLTQTVSHSFSKLSAALPRKFGTDEANRAGADAMFFALPIEHDSIGLRSVTALFFVQMAFCFKFWTVFATWLCSDEH